MEELYEDSLHDTNNTEEGVCTSNAVYSLHSQGVLKMCCEYSANSKVHNCSFRKETSNQAIRTAQNVLGCNAAASR